MEYRKDFQFSNFGFSEDFSFEILLNGSGSFVITSPDWPPDAGVLSPDRDGRIIEEFIGCLGAAINMINFDYDCDTYSRIPYNTEVLVDYINKKILPFRWEFESGYRLKEISFNSLYPADEDSAKSVVNAKKLRNLDKQIESLQGSRDSGKISELNMLLSERSSIRKYFLDIKLKKVLDIKDQLESLRGQIPPDTLTEYQDKITQAWTQVYGEDSGFDPDEEKMRKYQSLCDKIDQSAPPAVKHYKALESQHFYLADNYNELCEDWDMPSEYQE